MRAPSSKWFEEIARVRDGSDGADRSVPLFPWLAPPLARSVRDVIERWGVVRHLRAGDPVLGGQSDRVDKVVLVKSGITVRHFGSSYAQHQSAYAISLPGRLACGNLNFFTSLPCVGRYYALVPSTVTAVSQDLLRAMCRKDAAFCITLLREFESIALTDRIGFGATISLTIRDRILAFLLTWAAALGSLTCIDGALWVRIPTPLSNEALRSVIYSSQAAFERAWRRLREEGIYVAENDGARVLLSALKPIHLWLRHQEERQSDCQRGKLELIFSETSRF